MRTRPDHREAVARRVELLRSDLEAGPGTQGDRAMTPPAPEPPWWETVPVMEPVPRWESDPTVREPRPVPIPGRHAARRTVAWNAGGRLGALLPETLRGRIGIGPWQLTVIALTVAAGLAVTCWWTLRGDAAVAPVATGPATPLVAISASPAPSAMPGATPAAAGSGPPTTVTVDVAGKVRRPGVLELPTGSRVVDAIKAAGGAKRGTDLTGLNQARVLVDGEQIAVGAAVSAPVGSPTSGVAGVGTLVNLNAATAEELETLPGVGPVTAQSILDYRAEHGGFGSVDELLDIEGIGEKTLEKIAPHVTV